MCSTSKCKWSTKHCSHCMCFKALCHSLHPHVVTTVRKSRVWDVCRLDDSARSQLRLHLSSMMPVELVLPADGLSNVTRKLLRGMLRSPRINHEDRPDTFWSPELAVRHLKQGQHFGEFLSRSSSLSFGCTGRLMGQLLLSACACTVGSSMTVICESDLR